MKVLYVIPVLMLVIVTLIGSPLGFEGAMLLIIWITMMIKYNTT